MFGNKPIKTQYCSPDALAATEQALTNQGYTILSKDHLQDGRVKVTARLENVSPRPGIQIGDR